MELTANIGEIAQLMNDWHTSMRITYSTDVDHVKYLVEQKLDEIKKNDKTYLLYLLLTYRYHTLTQNTLAVASLEEIHTLENCFDGYTSFLLEYFKGLYAYEQKDCLTALSYFNAARDYLKFVHDSFDLAEFHYRVAASYYKMGYCDLSITNAKKALSIYKENELYKRRWVSCLNLIGAGYTDSGKFVLASACYEESSSYCSDLGNQEIKNITFQNLGWLYSRMAEPEKAIDHYIMALEHNERADHQLPTLFLLSRECFRFGEEGEGIKWVTEGLKISQQVYDHEYLWHFKILDAFYVNRENLENTLNDGIGFFKNNVFWDYVKDYALELADQYYDREMYQKAAEYYKLVGEAEDNFTIKRL